MPKQRQIPRLFDKRLADGTTVWHWKPSKSLRDAGFVNVKLGSDRHTAIAKALHLNKQVDSVREGQQAKADDNAFRALPVFMNTAELIRRYVRDDAFTGLAKSTQREYRSRLGAIERWAQDGRLQVAQIDRQMVLDLRNGLLKHASKFKTAAILRVLRLLLAWAVDAGVIAENPALAIRIPEPPRRRRRLIRDDLSYLLDSARAAAMPHVEIGTVLGFYTTQRESDLLDTTRFRLKPITDVSAEARRALGGVDGTVVGIVLEQNKTDEWVSIPLVPQARSAIEQLLPAQDGRRRVSRLYLLPHPKDGGRCPDWRFQRDFRACVNGAVLFAIDAALRHRKAGDRERAWEAIEAGKRLRVIQFRDLRRSGMCWMRDLGVPVPLIAAISGHSIEQTQKILDTYMPRDTRAAAEGMAMAVLRQAERDNDAEMKEAI